MTKSKTLIVVALAAVGLLVAQSPMTTTTDGHDWEIVTGNVVAWSGSVGGASTATVPEGWAKGDAYLYNKRTGKVYLHVECDSGPVGCFAALPVIEEADAMTRVTPTPQTGRISDSAR